MATDERAVARALSTRLDVTAVAREAKAAPGPATDGARLGYFGVEGLDSLAPLGMSYDTQVMVEGETGIGKSMLCLQFIYEGLMVGDTCVYVTCDEPPDAVRASMASLRLGTQAYEAAGRLVFVDGYHRERSTERFYMPDPSDFDEFFMYEKWVVDALGERPMRLVVDSLSTVMATASTDDIIRFNSNRLRYLRSKHVLTLDTVVTGILDAKAMNSLRQAYAVIVEMRLSSPTDRVQQRTIQLGKLKSGQFNGAQQSFQIDPRMGIIVSHY